jgi:hypothetical protein
VSHDPNHLFVILGESLTVLLKSKTLADLLNRSIEDKRLVRPGSAGETVDEQNRFAVACDDELLRVVTASGDATQEARSFANAYTSS